MYKQVFETLPFPCILPISRLGGINGQLNFRNDLYNLAKKLSKEVFGEHLGITYFLKTPKFM